TEEKYMNILSVKLGYISLLLLSIPLFSAEVESKTESPKDTFVRLAGFVSKGNIENIDRLITEQSKNLQTDSGMSLLHYAVLIEDSEKRVATVQCLLSHNVAVNLITAKSTPLDIAEFSCGDFVKEIIIKAGGKKYGELEVPQLVQSGVSKKQLVKDFQQQFDDETGISALTKQLISSAKTEEDAIALCKAYIQRSAKTKFGTFMYQNCAQDALGAWARATGNKKPSLMALDNSDSESSEEDEI
ncbi:MAG: hypothetical protein ACHQVS_03110, partial [Candidatus Babeliales bacterium]